MISIGGEDDAVLALYVLLVLRFHISLITLNTQFF